MSKWTIGANRGRPAIEHAPRLAAQQRRDVDDAGDDRLQHRGGSRRRPPAFCARNFSSSENSKTSSTRPSGVVIAWPRWMSMPKYDSTPEMFENRNGLSSVTTDSSQMSSCFSSEAWTLVRMDVAGEPHVAVDRRETEQREVAARQAVEKRPELGLGDVLGPPGDHDVEAGVVRLDQLVGVAERQAVVGVDVEPPEQLFLPGRQRLRADRADVGERQQAQHLQLLFGPTSAANARDDLGILGVAQEATRDIAR